MDEVDKIVLSSLKEMGYIPREDITNLKLYPFEELLAMVMCCFRKIRPESNIPSSLPPTMSVRYNLCSQFAQICKDLGYKREVGYHTFMYKNTNEIREVLLFLVEHLPKKSSYEEPTKDKSQNVTIKQKVGDVLRNTLVSRLDYEYSGMCEIPFLSVPLETGTLLPNQKIDCKPLEWREFVAKELPYVDEQLPDKRCLLPSIIALNSKGLIFPTNPKNSKFSIEHVDGNIFQSLSLQSSLQLSLEHEMSNLRLKENDSLSDKKPIENTNTDERLNQEDVAISESNDEYEETINELQQKLNTTKVELRSMKENLQEVFKNAEIAKKQLQEKETHESLLEKSITLLPDFEDNIPKLKAANKKCHNKIITLQERWERHKELLLSKKAELQSIVDNRMVEKNRLLQSLTDLRMQLLEVTQEIEKRNLVEQRLRDTEVDDGVQRIDFIKRILEMIKNIKKQDEQIETTLNDMKTVQKDINNLSGKVERSYAITEHIITPNATDELSSETHTLIVTLHKDINDILNMIDETGKYAREIKDLEDQVRDSSNNVEEALKEVMFDMNRLKVEQISIVNEIAKYTAADTEKEALETSFHTFNRQYSKPSSSNEDQEEYSKNRHV